MEATGKGKLSAGAACAALMLALLFCASGCRPLEVPMTNPVVAAQPSDSAAAPQSPRPPTAQTVSVYRVPADDDAAARPIDDDRVTPVDYQFSPPRGPDQFLAGDGSQAAVPAADAMQSPLPLNTSADQSAAAGPPKLYASEPDARARFGDILAATRDDVWHDYGNFYTCKTAVEFTAILAPAAVFANSDWDADVGNWYQEHVRSVDTNRASNFLRPLGNGYYTIPIYVSAKFLGEYFDDEPGMALLGQFGDRVSRALLVGAPPFLALQYTTGGGRPSDFADESYWRPFRGSHGASGHAFMGAMPFITLADMTDDPLAKCFFFACSPWTGFTRINDNVHYLSQVWLGWWMAYLACDAVNKTESQRGPGAVTIAPLVTPEMSGVGVVYQH